MISELESLSVSEQETMLKAPMLVCILIAGADDKIDRKEMRGAIELAEKKKEHVKNHLAEFYHEIAEDFEDKLKFIMQGLPGESEQRTRAIASDLANLNAVFPRLNKVFARDFYGSLRYIALKIAESSGGILKMKTVGEAEKDLIKLSMIKEPSAA